MFPITTRTVSKAWNKFINPQNTEDAFLIWVYFFRIGGIFPYAIIGGQYKISTLWFGITLAHITLYTFVNIHLLYGDMMVYAEPLIVDSTLAIATNLLTKGLGVLITLIIFVPIVTGVGQFVNLLNRYNLLMDGLKELEINVNKIFRGILITSCLATLCMFGICLYGFLLGLSFYEKINHEPASLQYVYVVILSDFYKNICVFSLASYLATNYLVCSLLNGSLEKVLKAQKKISEASRMELSEGVLFTYLN